MKSARFILLGNTITIQAILSILVKSNSTSIAQQNTLIPSFPPIRSLSSRTRRTFLTSRRSSRCSSDRGYAGQRICTCICITERIEPMVTFVRCFLHWRITRTTGTILGITQCPLTPGRPKPSQCTVWTQMSFSIGSNFENNSRIQEIIKRRRTTLRARALSAHLEKKSAAVPWLCNWRKSLNVCSTWPIKREIIQKNQKNPALHLITIQINQSDHAIHFATIKRNHELHFAKLPWNHLLLPRMIEEIISWTYCNLPVIREDKCTREVVEEKAQIRRSFLLQSMKTISFPSLAKSNLLPSKKFTCKTRLLRR